MPSATDSGHSRPAPWAARLPASRTIWGLAIVVLGLNIWISFLLLPVVHLEQPGIGALKLATACCCSRSIPLCC